MKILVPYGDSVVSRIQDILGTEATVVQSWRTSESMIKKGRDVDIVISGRVPGDYIRAAPNLKMIQTLGAGVDLVDLEAVRERNSIIVCNVHINAVEVAEYTIMLLLAAAKQIIMSDKTLRQGDWKYGWGGPSLNIELQGKTCLLIGLGNVGMEIVKRLRGFGMTLFAVTRSGIAPEQGFVDKIIPIRQVEQLVRTADFIILSLPLTPETKGLVDEEFISWMKSSSILINISRGPIVDETAIYKALQEKRIHSAALDVWWDYPRKFGNTQERGGPSDRFPFHELSNVIVSPHRASYSEGVVKEFVPFAGNNVLRFIRGETPQNVIDLQLGY